MNREPISPVALRRKVFGYAAASMLVFCLALLGTVSLPIYDRLKDADNTIILEAIKLKAIALDEWSRRVADLSYQITSRTRIRQELERYDHGDLAIEQLTAFTQPKLRDAMRLSAEILGIRRTANDGATVSCCGDGLPPVPPGLERVDPRQAAMSRPFELGGAMVAVFRAPIFSGTDRFLGTDEVLFNLDKVAEIVANTSGLGAKSAIILGYPDQDGTRVIFRAGGDGPQDPRERELTAYFARAMESGQDLDDSCAKHVLAFQRVGALGWGLAVLQEKDELYSTLHQRLRNVLGLSLLIYLACLAGLWLMTKPLATRLLLHTDELQQRIDERTVSLNEEIEQRRRAQDALSRSVADLKKARDDRDALIGQLQQALEDVKTLSGLLPICARCKKIRDDSGYWNNIESYIEAHSEAAFSHGLCPDCAEAMYGDQEWYIRHKNKKDKD